MKLTKNQLIAIIKEEVVQASSEQRALGQALGNILESRERFIQPNKQFEDLLERYGPEKVTAMLDILLTQHVAPIDNEALKGEIVERAYEGLRYIKYVYRKK